MDKDKNSESSEQNINLLTNPAEQEEEQAEEINVSPRKEYQSAEPISAVKSNSNSYQQIKQQAVSKKESKSSSSDKSVPEISNKLEIRSEEEGEKEMKEVEMIEIVEKLVKSKSKEEGMPVEAQKDNESKAEGNNVEQSEPIREQAEQSKEFKESVISKSDRITTETKITTDIEHNKEAEEKDTLKEKQQQQNEPKQKFAPLFEIEQIDNPSKKKRREQPIPPQLRCCMCWLI